MYAIVDIETTGGYAENHRITEVAIYLHDGMHITDCYQTLVNPERRIPNYITGLTGITREMVATAPTFREVADEIHQRIDGKIFVAHHAHFDYAFLKKELEAVGIQWQAKSFVQYASAEKLFLASGLMGWVASAMDSVSGSQTAIAQVATLKQQRKCLTSC